MKRILLIIITILSVNSLSYAGGPRAIGANLGGGFDFSYQHAIGTKNMLDISAGFPWAAMSGYGFGLGGGVTFDWINPFNTQIHWEEDGEWNWYMGIGASGGLLFGKDTEQGTGAYTGLLGHIGVEYDFEFPLQLSLDWRPTMGVYINGGSEFYMPGLFAISLGVRYKF
ncbi:MAG: hypothetical protein II502_01885 [Paludibacteraceae bacterium]|nr:hypothetical protein [Paludibacteraceae bacterium]